MSGTERHVQRRRMTLLAERVHERRGLEDTAFYKARMTASIEA